MMKYYASNKNHAFEEYLKTQENIHGARTFFHNLLLKGKTVIGFSLLYFPAFKNILQ